MATKVRAKVSKKNKYWIDMHRHYELKHFCLQYPDWKRSYAAYNEPCIQASVFERSPSSNIPSDLTAKYAILKAEYDEKIKLVERAAMDADEDIYEYILKGVTTGLSYTYLKEQLGLPCGKDMYYDRYRRFFWLLSKMRG